jgi:DNA-binding transcriptional ArsR family regulator
MASSPEAEFPITKCFAPEAAILKTLGHPLRIKILFELHNEKCNVTTLSVSLGMHQAIVSYHLRILRNLRIISGNRNGTEVFYRIDIKFVRRLLFILSA